MIQHTYCVLCEVDADDEEPVEHRAYDTTYCVLCEVQATAEETLEQREYNKRIWHQMAAIRQITVITKE